jgi:uncharacterized membrane protein YdjX (TVP38/TMEM64 family)
MTLEMVTAQLRQALSSSPLGPVLFLLVAALSPLILFPAALLGVVAGHAFGFWFGLLLTLVGCNLSASVAYGIGRQLRPQPANQSLPQGRVARWMKWMQQRGFVAVLVLRITCAPYDAVSYLAGTLRIGWVRFLVANTLGCLPGALALVGLGVGFDLLR